MSTGTEQRFAPAQVRFEARADGGCVLHSAYELLPYETSLGARLSGWAERAPDRVFLAERATPSTWRTVTFGETLQTIRSIAQGLLDLGLDRTKPLAILSDNAFDHALVALAAMHVGIPASPISTAYSLVSRDHTKLIEVLRQLSPGAIYAANGERFGRALDAADAGLGRAVPRIVSTNAQMRSAASARTLTFAELAATKATVAVDRAFASVGLDTVAKVLFTSGSTGAPKGIANTQRMLCSNQQGISQTWPFLARSSRPPVVVDWLPWSHTFGGNHNFNMLLWNGGTLYIDGGKPSPDLVPITVVNLREIAPTMYFNVPRGFAALLPYLESEPTLAATFFSQLELIFYAAAALPQSTWERLEAVAAPQEKVRGSRVSMVAAWGSTETSPLALQVHFPIPRAGVIGLPPPGTSVALVPVGDKWELRAKGPNITPGGWEPGGGIVPVHLDKDGFLPTGDAGRLEDATDPARGLVFDGRIAENFKLTSGTWVAVGALRVALVGSCAPLIVDAVIAGHDRDEIGALLFVDASAVARLGLDKLTLRDRIRAAIAARNETSGASSQRIACALLLDEPLSLDAGEITDKGYVNQRAVLSRRASDVDRLYRSDADDVLRF